MLVQFKLTLANYNSVCVVSDNLAYVTGLAGLGA